MWANYFVWKSTFKEEFPEGVFMIPGIQRACRSQQARAVPTKDCLWILLHCSVNIPPSGTVKHMILISKIGYTAEFYSVPGLLLG